MSRHRSHKLCLLGWLTMASLLSLVAPEAAAKSRTAVAVEALPRADMDHQVQQALSQSMQITVNANPRLRVVPREQAELVLYASITGLSDQRTQNERKVDCRVSVIVTDAAGGAIRMTLSGRAVARGVSREDGLTLTAMGAAVRSALTSLDRGIAATR